MTDGLSSLPLTIQIFRACLQQQVIELAASGAAYGPLTQRTSILLVLSRFQLIRLFGK